MSRAQRRRAEREAKKNGPDFAKQFIQLKNPVGDQFEVYIFGNSLQCERVVVPGSADGKSVVICGAGPSLADEIDEWAPKADDLWGCNSALVWLHGRGYPVTHGITVDQTPAMLIEWASAPDVEYLVASTIHPHLTEHLLQAGRRITWFHNFVGLKKPPVSWCECGHDHERGDTAFAATCIDPGCDCDSYRPRVMHYEEWLYMTLYPPAPRTGSGLNTVNRAIDLAIVMGYSPIYVLGADCALRINRPLPLNVKRGTAAHRQWLQNETTMHVDGGNALASGATAVTLGAEIDGVWWESKPDMLVSAMWLIRLQQALGEERLQLIGNTYPNALLRAQRIRTASGEILTGDNLLEEVAHRLPTIIDTNGNPIPIEIPEVPVA